MTVNLNDIIKGMDKMLRRLIRDDIEFTVSLDPTVGLVRIDPGQMTQVIMNLVVNARDAVQPGGHIRIETANGASSGGDVIGSRASCPGCYASLSVTDDGCGMSPSTMDRMFEPFFTTKAQGEGTGLGLSIVYAVTRRNGGEIFVESAPGKGTRIEVVLPVVVGIN